MSIALFDLDNTLLAGDSDYEWGRYLVRHGVVDEAHYEQENLRFYADYKAGRLDIYAFARFAYRPLAETPLARLHELREGFIAECVRPMILPRGRQLLERHRAQRHTLIIVTATNRFVTEPIAQELGVEHLLATEPEFHEGRFTGELTGTPCFREGKVLRLQAWLAATGHELEESWFYSDSHNDLPLLEAVTHPVAVDPDAQLETLARQRGWPRISLREPGGE